MLAHPPTTARAVRLDGDVSCGKAGVVRRALVGVAEVVGAHEAGHTVVPGQGEGLGDTPCRQASVITAITETERDRDRETETDTKRETEKQRQTETEIEKQRQTDRGRQRNRDRQTDRQRLPGAQSTGQVRSESETMRKHQAQLKKQREQKSNQKGRFAGSGRDPHSCVLACSRFNGQDCRLRVLGVQMAVQAVRQTTHLAEHVVVGRVESEHVAARSVSTLVVVVVHEDEGVTRVQHARGGDLLQEAEVLDTVGDGPAILEFCHVAKVCILCSLRGSK